MLVGRRFVTLFVSLVHSEPYRCRNVFTLDNNSNKPTSTNKSCLALYINQQRISQYQDHLIAKTVDVFYYILAISLIVSLKHASV